MTNKVYGSAWRKVRAHVLYRDQWRCQINGPKCTGLATQVDHITPLVAGGPPLDPRNLRAACASCNAGRPSPSRLKTPPASRVW